MKIKKSIDAVHKHDIRQLLENLGLLEDFQNKRIHCAKCGGTITEENLGALFPQENKILTSCSNIKCLAEITKET